MQKKIVLVLSSLFCAASCLGASVIANKKATVKTNATLISGWTRVTAVSDLTSGGTFIFGYEETANSDTIVPMRAEGSATTSAVGYLYSGKTAAKSEDTTVSMTSLSDTSPYEFEVGASSKTTGAITIKIGDNYVGNTNTKNNLKLFSTEATTTAFTPTIAADNNAAHAMSLAISENSFYKYLKYNSGSPRFAVYSTAPDSIIAYKKSNDPVTGLSLNKTTTSLREGETDTLTSTVLPVTANQNVVWSTNDSSIATVSGGTITAVQTGTAIITATTIGKTSGGQTVTSSCTVNVSSLPGNYLATNIITIGKLGWGGTATTSERPTAIDQVKYLDSSGYYFSNSGSDYISFSKNTTAYFANSTEYKRNISSVVIDSKDAKVGTDMKIFAGTTVKPATTEITFSKSASGYVYTYDFSGGDYKYFNVTRSSATNYVNINSITINVEDDAAFLASYIMESSTSQQCLTKYSAAKERYLALVSSEQTLFKTAAEGESEEITNARARYLAWAANRSDSTPWAKSSGSSAYLPADGVENGQTLVVLSAIGVSFGIAVCFWLIRKKHVKA